MSKTKKTLIVLLLSAGSMVANGAESVVGVGKIYKFTNSSGQTVYTDIMPSQESASIQVISAYSGMAKSEIKRKEIISDSLNIEQELNNRIDEILTEKDIDRKIKTENDSKD